MKRIFKEAHKMTRKMVKEYEVDYQAQFGLCLSYLLNKEEKEMKKNYIETKGFKIVVEGEDLLHYKGGKYVAMTENFTDEKAYMTKSSLVAILYTYKTDLANNKDGIAVKDTEFQELIDIKKESEKSIDRYFEKLDNVKLTGIGNGLYAIYDKPEGFEEMRKLNKKYFEKVKNNWIEENKKYFVVTEKWVKNGMGQMEKEKKAIFKKENIEMKEKEIAERNVKSEARKESEKIYGKLYELAETMNDEDFEDITGLRREDYLI